MKFKCRNIFAIIFSFIILLSCSNTKTLDLKNFKEVTLNKVIDGDVIKVSIDGKLESVRLLSTDAPKLKGKYPFSNEAKHFLEGRLSNTNHIYIEENENQRDSNGRILAYVWYDDNGKMKMLNDEIINEGLARLTYQSSDYKYLESLSLSQENAKARGNNIWSIEGYVSENGFKK